MVQKLEAINGGGGSIKVGTKGTINSLMTRELDSIKTAQQTPASFRHKSRKIPVSVPCSSATTKKLQPRKSLDRASVTGRDSSSDSKPRLVDTGTVHRADHGTSTCGGSNSMSYKSPQTVQKIPMLGSENVFDRTPSRQKSGKKVSNIVEVVDIKCGHSDAAWASPITNRLKKLGFSKLSENNV